MFSKLTLLVAITLLACVAAGSAASAAQVDNPGMFSAEGELNMYLHMALPGEVVIHNCPQHWEAEVGASGHFEIDSVVIDPPGSTGCFALEPCNSDGWEGQITSEHSFHLLLCVMRPGWETYIGGEATCSVGNGWLEIHCEQSTLTNWWGPVPDVGIVNPVELDGELTLSNAIEIES